MQLVFRNAQRRQVLVQTQQHVVAQPEQQQAGGGCVLRRVGVGGIRHQLQMGRHRGAGVLRVSCVHEDSPGW
ncbi:hypothetical protein, partial [Chromobacterium piscinae]|uniref:hypothetical protein n=1 Tax=Chromobacterium piscinae TaxID=686831 RepID=UPI003260C59E